MENDNEKIEDLNLNGFKIIQNKKYFCFGMDSVLLSDFAKNVKGKVIDLGSGTGIISILLCGKSNLEKIYACEFQKPMVDLIKRNIEINNLQYKMEVLDCDILDLEKLIDNQSIDNIVTNPPYMENGSGIKNKSEQIYKSKYETTCKIEDFIRISSKLLKPNGSLYMVNRPHRLVDIVYNLRKHNLEPKQIRFVYSNEKSENANLVLIHAQKSQKPFVKILKPLYIYNNDNNYTEEIYRIYNMEMK